MNGTISVLTAVDGTSTDSLDAAYRSLCVQHIPDGWEWEWLVVSDGPCVLTHRYLERDERIRYLPALAAIGTPACRNLALAHARGSVAVVLDADDLLLPGALTSILEGFAAYPSAAWMAGRTELQYSDGNTGPYVDTPLRRGLVAPGWLFDYRRRARNRLRCPLHPDHLAVRSDALRAVGGWPAYPAGSGLVMLYALAEQFHGGIIDAVTHQYRRWAAGGVHLPGNDPVGAFDPALVDRLVDSRVHAHRAAASGTDYLT